MREAIPPLPQNIFMAWCLVKRRDNFAFNFTFTCVPDGSLTCQKILSHDTYLNIFNNAYTLRRIITYYEMLHSASKTGCFEHGNELLSSIKGGNFLTSWVTISFSRMILLHAISYLDISIWKYACS
jgi:hypothetical protein